MNSLKKTYPRRYVSNDLIGFQVLKYNKKMLLSKQITLSHTYTYVKINILNTIFSK